MGWGGWPDKIHRAGVVNNSLNNVVADNLIFDHMQLLADGGAIYTQGLTGPSLAEGEKIIGNVIYNQLGSGHGIYTDNGCNNANGASAPSLPSTSIIPKAKAIRRPSAPARAFAEPGDGMASIHFQAPEDDGGSPIIACVFTARPGGHKVTVTGRSVLTLGGRHTTLAVVDGLENGQPCHFGVAAVNAAGTGTPVSTRPVKPTAEKPAGQ